jgi:type VI secretion system protein ImpL
LSFCQNSIANRYPLNRSSRNEVTLEDFGRFFGPGGELDQYFQKYLQLFVDTTSKPWRPKNPSLRVSLDALQQFQRAAEIGGAFFGDGKPSPSVRFQLKPILLSGEVEKFLLDLDGQQLTYSFGPARETAMQWPGPQGANWARLEFSPLWRRDVPV